MKTLKALFVLLLVPVFAHADPLLDNVFKKNEAGWFPSVGTPCPVVCKAKLALGENELYQIGEVRRTYVCKVRARNDVRGELYGNNFSDAGQQLARQCTVVDHQGKVYSDRQFLCLCVKSVDGGVNPPEPPERFDSAD